MTRAHLLNCAIGPPRRGVAALEAAIVLGVFLTLLLGSLDLSLMVLRDHTLAEAARRLARAAIVRGESSSSIATPWGPAAYAGSAEEETEFGAAIRDILVTINPADVQMQLSWPDGGNRTGDRVEVALSTEHRFLVGSLFGTAPYLLKATSTMRIEH